MIGSAARGIREDDGAAEEEDVFLAGVDLAEVGVLFEVQDGFGAAGTGRRGGMDGRSIAW